MVGDNISHEIYFRLSALNFGVIVQLWVVSFALRRSQVTLLSWSAMAFSRLSLYPMTRTSSHKTTTPRRSSNLSWRLRGPECSFHTTSLVKADLVKTSVENSFAFARWGRISSNVSIWYLGFSRLCLSPDDLSRFLSCQALLQ